MIQNEKVSFPMTTEVPGKSRFFSGKTRVVLDRLALFMIAMLVWHVLATAVIDQFWISSPLLVAERLWEITANGDLVWHATATIWQALLGMALGIVVGIAFGLVLASNDRLAEASDPYVMGLYSLPRIALAPLFILWFGIGLLSKVMMSFSFVVFIFLLNTTQGLREVDRDHIDLLRSMRASRAYIAWRVQFPAMLPWLFAAARISVGLALIGSVLGELLGANRGLGWYVEHASGRLDTTGVFAGLMALMIIAVAMNQAVNILEKWISPTK